MSPFMTQVVYYAIPDGAEEYCYSAYGDMTIGTTSFARLPFSAGNDPTASEAVTMSWTGYSYANANDCIRAMFNDTQNTDRFWVALGGDSNKFVQFSFCGTTCVAVAQQTIGAGDYDIDSLVAACRSLLMFVTVIGTGITYALEIDGAGVGQLWANPYQSDLSAYCSNLRAIAYDPDEARFYIWDDDQRALHETLETIFDTPGAHVARYFLPTFEVSDGCLNSIKQGVFYYGDVSNMRGFYRATWAGRRVDVRPLTPEDDTVSVQSFTALNSMVDELHSMIADVRSQIATMTFSSGALVVDTELTIGSADVTIADVDALAYAWTGATWTKVLSDASGRVEVAGPYLSVTADLYSALASVGTDQLRVDIINTGSLIDSLASTIDLLSTIEIGTDLLSTIEGAVDGLEALTGSVTALLSSGFGYSVGAASYLSQVVALLSQLDLSATDALLAQFDLSNTDALLALIYGVVQSVAVDTNYIRGDTDYIGSQTAVYVPYLSVTADLYSALASVGVDQIRVDIIDGGSGAEFMGSAVDMLSQVFTAVDGLEALDQSNVDLLSSIRYDLDVQLNTIRSILDETSDALATVGTDQIRVDVIDSGSIATFLASTIDILSTQAALLSQFDLSNVETLLLQFDLTNVETLLGQFDLTSTDTLLGSQVDLLSQVLSAQDELSDALASVGTDQIRVDIIDSGSIATFLASTIDLLSTQAALAAQFDLTATDAYLLSVVGQLSDMAIAISNNTYQARVLLSQFDLTTTDALLGSEVDLLSKIVDTTAGLGVDQIRVDIIDGGSGAEFAGSAIDVLSYLVYSALAFAPGGGAGGWLADIRGYTESIVDVISLVVSAQDELTDALSSVGTDRLLTSVEREVVASITATSMVLVNSIATLIVTSSVDERAYIVRNYEASTSNTVFLGSAGVTISIGFPLLSGEIITLRNCNDPIYGICNAATQDVRWMEVQP